MPTESARFHPEAGAEYDAPFDWYLKRSPDAALRFDAEVDRALSEIILHLDAGRKAHTRLAASSSDIFLLL